MNKTNSLLLAGVLSATLMTSVNVNAADMAAAPAAAPASPHTLTTNFGLYTDYIFRGISYARGRGSVQGSVDYSHANGLYAGVWSSNVDRDAYAISGNTIEIDVYGGYVHTFNPDLSVNLGALYYYYPNNNKLGTAYNANSVDLTAAVTYKYFTAKYSYMPSKYFGFTDSNGSGYVEFNANYPVAQLAGLNLTAHVGRQYVSGTGVIADTSNSVYNYTDWQVGVNKDFAIASSTGWNAGLSYVDTNADKAYWAYSADSNFYKPGESKVLAFIKRTF
jgi:uncharacterized protein (TIGR02001 family)